MQLSNEEFQRLGHRAVDIASNYLADLSARPVFQRMNDSERQTLMTMPMPAEPLAGEEILRLTVERILPHPMGNGHPRFFGWGTLHPP
jgi:aromatic-L-amino-acid/L-tryptophan decarboxylase